MSWIVGALGSPDSPFWKKTKSGLYAENIRLIKERDEARREAYRQWLMRQCDAEHEYGTHDEY
jgi:hypothetical protein